MNIYKNRLVKGVSLIQHKKGPQNKICIISKSIFDKKLKTLQLKIK